MRSNVDLRIAPLASHPEAIATLQGWFEAEWPSYYGPAGPGSAQRDLQAFVSTEGLPQGVVAYLDGELCGVAALKADSIASHAYLTPWAAAGLVRPDLRGRGIGAELVRALEHRARAMGFPRLYCGTSSAGALLERLGWRLREHAVQDGVTLALYERAL